MKNVLLINPIYNPGTIPPSIPLSKIAYGLHQCEIEYEVIDFVRPECEGKPLLFFKMIEDEFVRNIQKKVHLFRAVYITTGTGGELKPYPMFPRVIRIAEAIKKETNVPVYVGGALINLYTKVYGISKETLCGNCIDDIVIGNEYLGAMQLLSPSMPFSSALPLWKIWDKKLYPIYKSVQYHVGCPYKCDFCFEGKIYDKMNKMTRLDDFLSSVGEKEKIIIEDSVILSNPDFKKIASDFASKKVEYAVYARISEIIANPDKISHLSKSGCKAVIVGIETLDNNVLKKHNKSMVSKQTRTGIDILKYYGINIQGCFMLGFPEDSIDNMKKTIEFAIMENFNGYRWHIFQPNYSSLHKNFYSSREEIIVEDHLKVQLNIPDNCLYEISAMQPQIGKLDEHFMIRGKNYLPSEVFKDFGYKDAFSYQEIKNTVDSMFPQKWILNEEVLYGSLFEKKTGSER